ncbi:hypothetical protein, partial [Sphaerimonospora thailandensis]|uniref:hypothetical protein n=1 Tax=Sphaerimonospora thailandensis TaxID=795644 RepID=UPI00194E0DEA
MIAGSAYDRIGLRRRALLVGVFLTGGGRAGDGIRPGRAGTGGACGIAAVTGLGADPRAAAAPRLVAIPGPSADVLCHPAVGREASRHEVSDVTLPAGEAIGCEITRSVAFTAVAFTAAVFRAAAFRAAIFGPVVVRCSAVASAV